MERKNGNVGVERLVPVLQALQRTGGQLSQHEACLLVPLSKSQFSRSFHKVTGHDFRHERLRIKLQHAASLLTAAPMSITVIAHHIGYAQRGKFEVAFAREFGVTPSQYRRNSARKSK